MTTTLRRDDTGEVVLALRRVHRVPFGDSGVLGGSRAASLVPDCAGW